MTNQTMLVYVDPANNNNKFYEVTLNDDQSVLTRWGRIPDVTDAATALGGQSKLLPAGGMAKYEAAVAKKLSRGYTRLNRVTDATPGGLPKQALRAASRKALVSDADPSVAELVDRLVDVNAHTIRSSSGGAITVADDGQVRTSLGLIDLATVSEARSVLDGLDAERQGSADRLRLIGDYLRLVPQRVPRTAGWGEHWGVSDAQIIEQRDLLDALEQSIRFSSSTSGSTGASMEVDFRYRLRTVTDRAVIDALDARYRKTSNRHHGSTARMSILRVWELTDTSEKARSVTETQQRVGNMQELWHGTRAINLLSILATGFFVPPASASHTTGRMFGDGVYLSEQSTKSLNYSAGRWAGTRDVSAFMLSVDTAMGRPYRPRHTGGVPRSQRGQYDSINVAAGTAGVRNHEAVVWNTDQLSPRYLIEFA